MQLIANVIKKMNIMMTLPDVLRVIQINARLEVHVLNVSVHQKVNAKIGKKQKFVNWMVLLMVLLMVRKFLMVGPVLDPVSNLGGRLFS